MSAPSAHARPATAVAPRLGFLGLGWIGCARLETLRRRGGARIVALADPCAERIAAARALAPEASSCASLEDLLEHALDGVVIATPSALHAEQARACLAAGLAVFCQKPLARTAAETRTVVEAARAADRLLGVDLSYRHLEGYGHARRLLESGALGRPLRGRFVFHNAYGPDKPWFKDPALSGGGCLVDLGTHLVDLALGLFRSPVVEARARLFTAGRAPAPGEVEDHAVAWLELASGAFVELACSWWLPLGRDACIEATVLGERGGIAIRNVRGSFYDFRTLRLEGTSEHELVLEGGEWGGGALAAWVRRLAADARFDPEVASAVGVAEVIDRIYGR